jgi:hypothetical protein
MADKHPSGNPRLVEQHKNIQRQGDAELKGTADMKPDSKPRKPRRAGDRRTKDSGNSGSRSTGGSFVGP